MVTFMPKQRCYVINNNITKLLQMDIKGVKK
jgi:hypothetical protein